jgi:hypothetical protein
MTYLSPSEFEKAYNKWLKFVVLKWLKDKRIVRAMYDQKKIVITIYYHSDGSMDFDIDIIERAGEFVSGIDNYLKEK